MQELRNSGPAQEPADPEEKRALQNRQPQSRGHASFALPEQGRQHDHEEDDEKVLENSNPQGHPRARTVRHPEVLEGLDAHRGGGECDGNSHREGSRQPEAKRHGDPAGHQGDEDHLPAAAVHRHPPQVLHLLQREFEPQGKKKEDDPQLREGVEISRARSDPVEHPAIRENHSANEVADEQRLTKAQQDQRDQDDAHQDEGQQPKEGRDLRPSRSQNAEKVHRNTI